MGFDLTAVAELWSELAWAAKSTVRTLALQPLSLALRAPLSLSSVRLSLSSLAPLRLEGMPIEAWAWLAAVAAVVWAVWWWLDVHPLHRTWVVGDKPTIVHHPESPVAKTILSRITVGRFWPTPWLCSPHLQTTFLHFLSRNPPVVYSRELVTTPDGGTLALDWVYPPHSTVAAAAATTPTAAEDSTASNGGNGSGIAGDGDMIPIVIVVPGLTSDSDSQYVKHCAAEISKKGWRVLVANHRGLGGVKITSQRFYHAGWTTDVRFLVQRLQRTHPHAPLYAVGTSLGANIIVKYLGEEGSATPIRAAFVVGCPWDLVICDRWMNRRTRQRMYNSAMAVGLRAFAAMHQKSFGDMLDVKMLQRARSIRDFDDRVTRVMAKYETVDTYYRRCSSSQFLPGVRVPLLCVSALDDPICTGEAIPWDECRLNPHVVLAATRHGGHLAYFEGLTASRIWWCRVAADFLQAAAAAAAEGGASPLTVLGDSSSSSIAQLVEGGTASDALLSTGSSPLKPVCVWPSSPAPSLPPLPEGRPRAAAAPTFDSLLLSSPVAAASAANAGSSSFGAAAADAAAGGAAASGLATVADEGVTAVDTVAESSRSSRRSNEGHGSGSVAAAGGVDVTAPPESGAECVSWAPDSGVPSEGVAAHAPVPRAPHVGALLQKHQKQGLVLQLQVQLPSHTSSANELGVVELLLLQLAHAVGQQRQMQFHALKQAPLCTEMSHTNGTADADDQHTSSSATSSDAVGGRRSSTSSSGTERDAAAQSPERHADRRLRPGSGGSSVGGSNRREARRQRRDERLEQIAADVRQCMAALAASPTAAAAMAAACAQAGSTTSSISSGSRSKGLFGRSGSVSGRDRWLLLLLYSTATVAGPLVGAAVALHLHRNGSLWWSLPPLWSALASALGFPQKQRVASVRRGGALGV